MTTETGSDGRREFKNSDDLRELMVEAIIKKDLEKIITSVKGGFTFQ